MNDFEPGGPVREFTGKHMFAVVAGFFGVIIAVNITLAVFATGSWSGLVVPNGYVASQHFNETLANSRRQEKLGWAAQFGYDAGLARFVLRDRAGRFLPGFAVKARFARPTHERSDHTVVLGEVPGGYEAAVALAPGVWNVDVAADGAGGQVYQSKFRIFLRGEAPAS